MRQRLRVFGRDAEAARDLDAIAIFSDVPSHVKHAKMCMERGMHVISAVPACVSLEEAQELRSVKERTGLRYMMAETSYYRQACIHARELYQKGGFGQILYSEVEYYHDFNFEERLTRRPSLYFNPDGSNSWRQGAHALPTHSIGLAVAVTKERVTSVSCLGLGDREKMARIPNDRLKNPFFNEFALMETSGGHVIRHNECRQIAARGGARAQWFVRTRNPLARANFHDLAAPRVCVYDWARRTVWSAWPGEPTSPVMPMAGRGRRHTGTLAPAE